MNEKQIEMIKEILTEWNPLGDRASQIADLDNYNSEAIDILFEIEPRDSRKRVLLITKEVLNEAFNLMLSNDDCRKASESIFTVSKIKHESSTSLDKAN